MCNKQYSTGFRSSLAIAAIAVGLVAAHSPLASAHVATGPDQARHEQVQMHRGLTYAPVQSAPTYTPGVPPDSCDLPSAGCESYLSN